MKKLQLVMLAVIIAATLVGCGNSTPNANLKNDADTLSYYLGIAQSRDFKLYLAMRMGVDTTYMDQFFKGLYVGANSGDDPKKAAYNAGQQIGVQINNQILPQYNKQFFGEDTTQSLSVKNFLAGFVGSVRGTQGMLDPMEAATKIDKKAEEVREKVAEKIYESNKLAGEKFLAANAKKDGVKTLPSGVQYKILKEGHGEIPADTCKVVVNYEGRLINDTIFDSSYKRGEPIHHRVKQFVPGFAEALTHMPVGSEWEIYIPQEQAYGSRKQGKIDPLSALVFKVELLEIVK